ncbi:GntR family transcriptional regulator [Devosia rhodophyticola]|uniref:GntR family transcriptional regulator n=1 Tax=Devosia rhodophyticola TaxID=3026423 RepID=A0ABY7YZ19_9HYPH|nr:GntR family transcriptional regulator [Devosia rhodophyticola]WDR06484.1 GntR family transcriptional regulator [Devosia rhodophyticola]
MELETSIKKPAERLIDETPYGRILDDIGKGFYPGGTRLKVEELAVRYGTSTNPVREALRVLQGEGMVAITPNRGATVETFDADTLRDIFEVLQLLEPYFVASFAETCTASDIAELEVVQRELEGLPASEKGPFTECDARFHGRIGSSHYNRRAFSMWALQKRTLNALASQVPVSNARRSQIMAEHRALISAFKNNDVAEALRVIKKHIANAGEQMYVQYRARAANSQKR